ncbi:MMPL family transporter [Streptomyces sp. 8N706]|uniref:MMPL family transporter n=1 Tax=Streptomyces sp. 8N706 TaxID=3457416 RepID=UPI003FD20244
MRSARSPSAEPHPGGGPHAAPAAGRRPGAARHGYDSDLGRADPGRHVRGLRADGATEEIKQLGGAIAMGILLDTFLVRVLLVPAAVILLGRWNWWPSALSRKHPDEHTAQPAPRAAP